VNGALQWLEDNQDNDFEEIKAADTAGATVADAAPTLTDEDANSLVCDECGKKFRNAALASYHGDKTYITNILFLKYVY